ncbi:bifunctional SulP family inorganic anion transporter/carbonic anhydrase [Sphaerisporangium sp. TRM90804]|uniref:bifunctional SulP family inorganic anion transporter/carbonic anhydrase n=1 Tax=Sphaerisporangium sp. TRM90804 TaxID=3031113 RepID=UPI00244A4609|nr:bifunctional SulP family inorganic anion transporter/carbonic anhydrase [Sphaerisporangium sp. TRM90804]MDH2424314.1 bifunctional SulP family inorganic anion transporter/carbonic anhydrase [Sphaerisporangium sp. TRM90804]
MTGDTDGSRTSTQRLTQVLRRDLPASLVVFLVAVPLSLGIAVSSGAPLVAGLIAAVVGGLVAGPLGGSAVQVSGPAAGLALVVMELVHTYGWRATCMITLMAGVLQLVLGTLRVARAALAVSPAVVHGMLAGVGVVIALAQLHIVLGGQPQRSAIENLAELPQQIIDNHSHAVAVGVLTIAVLVLWPRLPRVNAVPAPLAALVIAALTAAFFGWDVARADLSKGFSDWATPILPSGDWHGIAGAVLLVALLAGVESLLCSVAADRMHQGPRADLDRELTGQGLANIVSGALGGLPIAGVIVRTTANVRAGARSRWSTTLHGLWVLLFAVCLSWTVMLIPMEALAALLVFIGVRMVNLGTMRGLHSQGELQIYVLTMGGVVLIGLAEGVLIGLGLGVLVALRRLTRVSVQVRLEPDDRWHVVVTGSLTFVGVPHLTENLRAIPAGTRVDLDLNVDFMDNAAFEALHGWRLDHERTGGTIVIDEIHDEWYTSASKGTRASSAKTPPRAPDRWWLPRAYRRRGLLAGVSDGRPEAEGARHDSAEAGRDRGGVPDLLAGAGDFQRRTAPLVRPILTRMARTQDPSHLFITCADSRVVPSLITASGPGDLFTVRNVGNLVPRYERAASDSVAAAIEYATTALSVRSITVCGHSGCGAMAAVLSAGEKTTGLHSLERWLRHGDHTLARYILSEGDGEDGGPLDRLCRTNVVQQLDNLRTYPSVLRMENEGRLQLVGLYFDIAATRVHVLDRGSFTPVPARPV